MSNVVPFRGPTTPARPTVRESFGILREQREPQIRLSEAMDAAIREKQAGVFEAGTGCGKSFAYLLALLSQGRRGIVTTHTLALQDQLCEKDLPFLQKALAERFGLRFTFAKLKGASNYACIRRVREAEREGTLPRDVLAWARGTTNGDLAEAPEMAKETRERVRIDMDDCAKKDCPFFDSCHYRIAREAAKGATILVINHAICCLSAANPFLLEFSGFDALIVDEAHQFEAVARDAFGASLSPARLRKFFTSVEAHLVEPENEATWTALRDAFRLAWANLLNLQHRREDGTRVSILSPDVEGEQLLVPIEDIRAKAQPAMDALSNVAAWVQDRLRDEPSHNRIARQLETITGFFANIQEQGAIAVAERFVPRGSKWASVKLVIYPLFVGPKLQATLYRQLPVIYTSATISAGGDFAFTRDALGLPADAPSMELGSPFDYPRQSLLYVPRGARFDPSGPGKAGHALAVQGEADRLIGMSRGRAFVLFTSKVDMRAAFEARRHSYPSRLQEDEGSKNALIEWFKGTPNAVLYAVASFWEGVSIEGEALSLVVINKIPFPPPDDPIFQAKGARMIGRKPFFALSVPHAIIKLKQGFGRLVRTQTDHGIVAILDSRIVGKGYGNSILSALPPARLVHEIDATLAARYLEPRTAPDEGEAPEMEASVGW